MEIHIPLLIIDIVTSVILIGLHLQEMNAKKKENSNDGE